MGFDDQPLTPWSIPGLRPHALGYAATKNDPLVSLRQRRTSLACSQLRSLNWENTVAIITLIGSAA